MKSNTFFIIALCIFLIGLLYGCVEEKAENEAPTCTLSSNHYLGTVPLTVTFTLTASDSDGSISSWKLDIDNDGSVDYSGTGNPPLTKGHTYSNQGSYTAKLTVTDNKEKTGTDTITITVNEPTIENQSPTCTLSVIPSSGYAPLTVTFSMDADDPDGAIDSWSLDINNDGAVDYSGTGNPSSTREHTYTSPGTYTAKLTVIDNQGTTDTDTVTISATEEPSGNQSPTCSFTVNPSSGYVPLSATFTMSASDPDGSISSWELDINNDGLHDYTGSGNPASSLQHIYTNTGTYTAKLTVTDDQGAAASYTRTITVSEAPIQNQPPTCSLSANPASGYAPLSVIFSLSGTDPDGTITSWALDINNDGTPDYSGGGTPPSTKQHTYQNSGTFTAKLTVTDDDGSTSYSTQAITVNEQPSEPIVLQGSGDTATNTFILDEGVAIFHMTHNGNSNFAITLYNGQGEWVDLLVNTIGGYSGSTLVGVAGSLLGTSPGAHLLDITADGNWQVTIEQPKTFTPLQLPQTFTGEGDTVTEPFMLESGIARFEMSHNGDSNFAITLYTNEGEWVDLLVNEIGDYSGSKIVGVTGSLAGASPGTHLLKVTADGDWTITITHQ